MDGFCEEEEEVFRMLIRTNIVRCMHDLVLKCDILGIRINHNNTAIAEEFRPVSAVYRFSVVWTREVADRIIRLWADPGIQKVHSECQYDSFRNKEYFMNSISRFVGYYFEVTNEDFLRLDVQETGVKELEFAIQNCSFVLIDVGPQRGNMKRWLPFFQDVNGVIFCAALNEFDQRLPEDSTVNRMQDTLEKFECLVNNACFPSNTPFIVMLTRKDVFEEKIKSGVSLKQCFPEYSGSPTFEDACNFVRDKFVSKNNCGRDLIVHVTLATNCENLRVVFNSIHTSPVTASYENSLF